MKRMTRLLIVGLAAAAAASWALAASPGTAPESPAAGPAVAATEPLRVTPWQLLQGDGAELYQALCSSCHGADATGSGPAAGALVVPPPNLTHLKRAGVPKEHWTYVILSGYEDHHHWAPDGSATMPCWQRIFRQALGHEAAPLMVAKKLTGYLETIQE